MANRVVLGAFDGDHVLRASRPGYNVLNAGLQTEFLAFDSRWSEVGNVFLQGSVVRDTDEPDTEIMFGETFSTVPLIIVYRSTDTANVWEPVMASLVRQWQDNPVHLETDRFFLFHNDGLTRTFVYACCRNLYD